MKEEDLQHKDLVITMLLEEVGQVLFLLGVQLYLEIKFNFKISIPLFLEKEKYHEYKGTTHFKGHMLGLIPLLEQLLMIHAGYPFMNKEGLYNDPHQRFRTKGFL